MKEWVKRDLFNLIFGQSSSSFYSQLFLHELSHVKKEKQKEELFPSNNIVHKE